MSPSIRNFSGPEAFFLTLERLYIHFVIGIALAVIAGGIAAAFYSASQTRDNVALVSIWRKWFSLSTYCLAFCTFGIATAYFLSLGLNPRNAAGGNSLLNTFASPFIALLTAGVAFIASKSRHELVVHELVLGVSCFLMTTMTSYSTFSYQLFEHAATDPGEIDEEQALTVDDM